MPQHHLRAAFIRGGTSKAVVFHRDDLPGDSARWPAIFRAIMGSPDPNGRQLDGMGGGISSLSKVCIVGPSQRTDADVDYTFAQIGVLDDTVDYSGNCGNMSSAIGPFAVDEGIVPAAESGDTVVRIHNTNTGKLIVARFAARDGKAVVEGDMTIDGIAGSGAPIRLEFLDPGGAGTGRLLPTGNTLDQIDVPGLGRVEASLIDAANPCVFVEAAALGKTGIELPEELEADAEFLSRLETIRRIASVMMGIAPDAESAGRIPSIPKIAIVSGPQKAAKLSGRELSADEMDLAVRMLSIGRPHRVVPITGALCLAVATRVPGSLPNALARTSSSAVRIAQPSGMTLVDAEVVHSDAPDGGFYARHAAVYRTSRRLFEGSVFWSRPGEQASGEE